MSQSELEAIHAKFKIFLKFFHNAIELNFLPDCGLQIIIVLKMAILPASVLTVIVFSIQKIISIIGKTLNEVEFLYLIVLTCCNCQTISKFLICGVVMKKKLCSILMYPDEIIFNEDETMGRIRQKYVTNSLKFGYNIASCGISITTYQIFVVNETNFTSIMFFTFPHINKGSFLHIPLNLGAQSFILIYSIGLMVLVDILFIFMTMYFKGELESLSEFIGSLNGLDIEDFEVDLEGDHRKILRIFCEFYTKVMRIKRIFLDICWYTYLILFSTSIIYVCLLIYIMSFSSAGITIYIIPLAPLSQMFLVCFIGEMVYSSGEAVSTALTATNWYMMTTKNQKTFLMLLAFSQRPSFIRTFGFEKVTLHTFLQLMKAMGSYCAFLYTVLH
ncbi:odorant receptor 4-like [Lutzomyia longipalpis]|uniref:odorant receptor 4-like n=1 Tax=Lutzomyia longipalpis TaxID=7200 RepID=UPI0024846BE7|nr:odorant receptor 4-like [Lutzomyia longipalpis]